MAEPTSNTPIAVLAGPTASGKTLVGLELAERLGAEIIVLDSMTLYRHMDIGTAKPTAADRHRVTHHLLDVVTPDQDFSLVDYLTLAHRVAAEIRARGRQVLFVGGTECIFNHREFGLEAEIPFFYERVSSRSCAA